MSGWRVAIVRAQQLELAVVAVDEFVLDRPDQRDAIISWWQEEFDRPIVLLVPETRRAYGRGTIAEAIAGLDPKTFAWWRLSIASPPGQFALTAGDDGPRLPARRSRQTRPTLDLMANPRR